MKCRLDNPFVLAALGFAATAASIVTAERASAQVIKVAFDGALLMRAAPAP